MLPSGAALEDRHKALGRATWRLDGFVSLDIVSEVISTSMLMPATAGLVLIRNPAIALVSV